ncbi:hypothetical protein L686_21810 [Stutzerimonas stutzeri MF28]|nr:hypothetical protein L686_21810 [Stutzerimonas stutzeri MF28]
MDSFMAAPVKKKNGGDHTMHAAPAGLGSGAAL